MKNKEEVMQIIEQLAESLNSTAENIWNVLIAQAKIHSITGILLLVILCTFLFYLFKFIDKKTSIWAYEGKFFAWLIFAIIFVLSIFWTIDEIYKIITGFVNPEYWALIKLIEIIN